MLNGKEMCLLSVRHPESKLDTLTESFNEPHLIMTDIFLLQDNKQDKKLPILKRHLNYVFL